MANWPQCSPLVVVETIKDVISGKSVCHLGCKDGDITVKMGKYTSEISGIELKPTNVINAKRNGIKVKQGDYFRCPIPEADAYYMWPPLHHPSKILYRICFDLGYDCIFMVGFGDLPSPGKDYMINAQKNRGGYIVEGTHNEAGGKHGNIFKVWVITSSEYRATQPS